jgi:hypothetical protein
MIALAEAQLAGGDRPGALRRFESALDESKKISSPKQRAALHLHLARTYAKLQSTREARSHLDQWKSLAPFVENGLLKAWAAQIEELLDSLDGDIFIPRDEQNLDYKYHHARLWKFLYQRALKQATSKEEAAEIMGISRQTLYGLLRQD